MEISEEEFIKEVVTNLSLFSTEKLEGKKLDFPYKEHAPAVISQSKFILSDATKQNKNETTSDWKILLKRRIQDRLEANDSWIKDDRKNKDKEQELLPGPVDPGCGPELSKTKYGFYIETDGDLSGRGLTEAFFVEKLQVATSEDGEFILYLNVPNFFDASSQESPFDSYFEYAESKEENRSNECEGIRHFPYLPCPLRVYVTDKTSGLQAELFDCGFGRVWLYNSFDQYDTDDQNLPFFIRMEIEEEDAGSDFFLPDNTESRVLHIYNKCERLELHGDKSYGKMGIALYKFGKELRIRIHSEFSAKGPGDFFGERLKFR